MMLWGLFLSCASIHNVGTLLDYNSIEERERNAQRAIGIALHETWSDSTSARTLAIQNLGLLRDDSEEVITGLLQLTEHPRPDLRRQALWALGEIGRELEWEDSAKDIVTTLRESLLTARSNIDAHYALDALLKVYCRHVHSIEEDLVLLRSLQQYLSQIEEPPSSFYILEREIQSLPVLMALIRERLHSSSIDVDALYTSNLALIRYLNRNRGALSDPQYRSLIKEVLTQELEMVSLDVQSLQLLSLWSLATSAHHDLISEEVAVQLVEQAPQLNDTLQVLVHMALWEMLNVQVVRTYFRHFISHNTDEDLYHVLGILGTKVDLIQQLYNVPVVGDTP